jgi:hypothetical protein
MIFGACPYCETSVANAFAGPGKFEQIECDECRKVYWLRHSNIDPEAFTQDQFAERYEVDHASKQIIDRAARRRQALRDANPKLASLIDTIEAKIVEETTRRFERRLLYGEPL